MTFSIGESSSSWLLGQDAGERSRPAGHGGRAAPPPVPTPSRPARSARSPDEAVSQLAHMIHRLAGQAAHQGAEGPKFRPRGPVKATPPSNEIIPCNAFPPPRKCIFWPRDNHVVLN